MAFDGFITKAVISELNNTIIGGKINKIYEPTKNEIILGIYNNGINYLLELSANPESCRICLTTHTKPNPQNAFNFCMLLRKYLTGSKIIEISNYDLERTVKISFEGYNELNDLVKRNLYIEIMSRQSNIILTNEKNIIIDTLKHFDNSKRELLPAHEYTFTPITKLSFLEINNLDYFIEIINKEKTSSITKTLCNTFIGFSTPIVKEILKQLNIDDTDFSEANLEKIYLNLKNITNNFGTDNISCIYSGKKDFTLSLIYNEKPLNINYFIDDFYYEKEKLSMFINSRNNLLKIVSSNLKKIYKKLENINQKLKECENMDKFRLYGELLTANLYKISSTANTDCISIENYYDNNNLIEIPLDKSISIQKNIQKYFKKYNKLKNALEIVSIQKKDAEKELDYIGSIVFSLESAKTLNDLNEIYEEISENFSSKKDFLRNKKDVPKKKVSNTSSDFETIEFEGYTIYIGKNNIQNDYISLKLARQNDIWFHTQKIHGSHILLKNFENLDFSDIPEQVLYKCACLAKENSKASLATNVSVDYCFARYVKKVSGAKPGMVIYTNFKTIIVK